MRGGRGKGWEAKIVHQNREYRKAGRAVVFQCHPETKLINGRPIRSKGPPDFVGQIKLIGPVLFDAKEGRGTRWALSLLKDHQAYALGAWVENGGLGGIALRLEGRSYWVDWKLLGPVWWAWREKVEGRLSSLTVAWLDSEAEVMDGADWLPAMVRWRNG